MGRFDEIKSRLLALAKEDAGIQAIIEIGSQARQVEAADQYSDWDVLVVTKKPEAILYEESILARLGQVMVSFTEATLAGLTERRVLFRGSLDVDLIPITPWQLMGMDAASAAVLAKGYRVLLDKLSVTETLARMAKPCQQEGISEEGFANLCGDFWYHTVWAAKNYVGENCGRQNDVWIHT